MREQLRRRWSGISGTGDEADDRLPAPWGRQSRLRGRPREPQRESACVEDLEATLDGLERRLRALQDELDAPVDPAPSPPPEPPPAPARPAPLSPDPLERFGTQLRMSAEALLAAYDRALAEARGGGPGELFSEDVAVEARTDLPGLCALSGALGDVAGVHQVELRAYAGGHAVLDVALDRPVALVRELQRAGGPPLAVLEARPGRLAVEVGAPPPAAGPGRR